jgi:hypothetical protein
VSAASLIKLTTNGTNDKHELNEPKREQQAITHSQSSARRRQPSMGIRIQSIKSKQCLNFDSIDSKQSINIEISPIQKIKALKE